IYDTKTAISLREKELLNQQSEVKELQTYLDENRHNLLKEAKEEARQIIKNANKLVENTISEIKQAKADKEKTKDLRVGLQRASDSLKEKPKEQAKAAPVVASDEPIEIGDWVRIVETGNEAQVIEIAKNNLILALGDLRTVVKKNKVEKLRGKEKAKAVKKSRPISAESVAD